MTTENAVNKLIKELSEDKEYRMAWVANIAMAFKDEYSRCKLKYKTRSDIHTIANQAAENFINQLTHK